MVHGLVWVDLVVVEVDGGRRDGVDEHQQQDEDVEPGRLEDALEEGRGGSVRFVFVERRHLPAFRVADQHLSATHGLMTLSQK